MKSSLSALCSEFIENRDIIKETFAWENTYIYPVCAAIFTDKRRHAESETLKASREILKKQTGVFSNFRGTAKLAMISMLALESNPELKLTRSLEMYSALKNHFFSSQYLPLVSMLIESSAEKIGFDAVAMRTRCIYDLMKSKHPFLTSGEDSVFAALLALSDMTDEQIVSETEKCYSLMRQEFLSGNAVQSLSHVLALGSGSTEEKCRKTMDIYSELKARGCKYGTNYELATLGAVALLPDSVASLADSIAEVDAFLAAQKGYGVLSVGKKQRLMHAGMIVTSDYSADSSVIGSAAVGATISLIAAQQAAMFAAIAASSASSSASSGGN